MRLIRKYSDSNTTDTYTHTHTHPQYKIYQEAETKHGRVAMLAFLGIVIGEMVNPLFDGAITGPAIYQVYTVL
jgi:hypothetical protein